MIEDGDAGDTRKRLENSKLDALVGFCETTGCRRQALLAYFGEVFDGACGNCDNCLQPPRRWDATEPARKALSCVYRTGQRFGAAHVIDVLRGADTAKVRQFGHESLSTHGIGADLDVKRWRSVFRQLVAGGFLVVDVEGHGALRLGAAATPLLRGEHVLELRDEVPVKRTRQRRNAGATTALAVELPASAEPRFEALRLWRATQAREQNVPAYVIFHDATLRSIALRQPRDLDALATISGVGAGKLERYGREVIAALEGSRMSGRGGGQRRCLAMRARHPGQ